MQCIENMREEKQMIDSGEGVMETLVQAAYRFEIENEANRKVEAINFKQVFHDLKKDEELSAIKKLILPKSGLAC